MVCGRSWVAWCFKNDNFPYLWPIKFVRVVVSFFFGTFYVRPLPWDVPWRSCVCVASFALLICTVPAPMMAHP